jgi:hypothetical protein
MGKTFNTGTLVNGVTVLSSGNVGIGTSSPIYRTHIVCANNTDGLVITTNANDAETGLYVRPDHTNGVVNLSATGGTNKAFAFNTGNTERLRITASGNVGINTTTPRALLDVRCNADRGIRISSPGVSTESIIACYQGDVSNNIRSLRLAGDNIYFNTGDGSDSTGSQRMVITSAGVLQLGTVAGSGVGTTSPVNMNLGSTFGTNTIGTNFKIRLFEDTSPNVYGLGVSSGLLEVVAGNVAAIAFFTNSSEKMRITSAGNVGIGISNPNGNLEVNAATPTIISGATSAASFHGFEFRQNNTIDAFIKQLPQTGELKLSVGRNSSWGGHMTFFTDTLERMRITSGGTIYIGGTSMANSQRFGIIGSGVWGGATLGLQNTGTSGLTYTIFSTDNQFSQGAGNLLFYNNNNNVNNLILYSNGNYDFAGSDISDRRLKQDIENINFGLDEIMSLSPKSYHLKSQDNLNGENQITLRKRYGFIAQEVRDILPDAITGTETETDYLGLDYNGVLAVAVKAIQELKAEIEILKNK